MQDTVRIREEEAPVGESDGDMVAKGWLQPQERGGW